MQSLREIRALTAAAAFTRMPPECADWAQAMEICPPLLGRQ
jgi:hypothetical protein